tara:strand:- start:13876 stop:14157 length:282 start_codon:yes stop_codon:yes gene_type:complete
LGDNVTHPTQTMGIDRYAGSLGGVVPDYWSYDLLENGQESLLISSTAAEKKKIIQQQNTHNWQSIGKINKRSLGFCGWHITQLILLFIDWIMN